MPRLFFNSRGIPRTLPREPISWRMECCRKSQSLLKGICYRIEQSHFILWYTLTSKQRLLAFIRIKGWSLQIRMNETTRTLTYTKNISTGIKCRDADLVTRRHYRDMLFLYRQSSHIEMRVLIYNAGAQDKMGKTLARASSTIIKR